MLPVFPQLHFYLYSQPTDMRKSFDGLSGIVTNNLLGNPTSGDVYVFINRRRDRMKLLFWEAKQQLSKAKIFVTLATKRPENRHSMAGIHYQLIYHEKTL